jgi:hypothetical protein
MPGRSHAMTVEHSWQAITDQLDGLAEAKVVDVEAEHPLRALVPLDLHDSKKKNSKQRLQYLL